MNSTLRLLVFALFALALGLAIRAVRERRQAETALVALSGQEMAMRETIRLLEERIWARAGGPVSFGTSNAPAAGEREAGVLATLETEAPATAAPHPSASTVIANDPKQMAEFAKNFREGLEYTCGGMFKALGLTPEQIEKAKDLIVSEQHSWMDMRAAAEMGGLDRAGYEALKQEQIAIRMKRQIEFLGPLAERFREYYHFTAPVRDLALRLAANNTYQESRVTTAQVERVAEVLAAHSQRVATGPWRGTVEPHSINWDAASAELRAVLPPTQIATLGLFVQNEAAQARVTQQINRLTAQFRDRAATR